MKIISKKRIDSVLVVLFIILAASIVIQLIFNRQNTLNKSTNSTSNREETTQAGLADQNKQIKVTIDFGDGRKSDHSVVAKNVYEALDKAAGSLGYKTASKEYKYGIMVEEINNIKNTKDKFWGYLVNNKFGQIAADRYLLSPGDSVEWKYTSVK